MHHGQVAHRSDSRERRKRHIVPRAQVHKVPLDGGDQTLAQFREFPRPFVRVNDAGHHIDPKPLLRVGEGSHSKLTCAPQIHQVAHDRGRTNVDGRAVADSSGARRSLLSQEVQTAASGEDAHLPGGRCLRDEDSAVALQEGLAGAPPALFDRLQPKEGLILRCGRRSTGEKPHAALTAGPSSTALAVDPKTGLPDGIPQQGSWRDPYLGGETLQDNSERPVIVGV